MTLNGSVTTYITKDLLTRVLTKLPSVSSSLPIAALEALVTTTLPNDTLQFAANNDLGLCVSRLLDRCLLSGITDQASLEQQYVTLRDNDPIVGETMNELSDGIAGMTTSPLYQLRQILPAHAKQISLSIQNALPPEMQDGGVSQLRHFSWGKLNHPQYRTAAMLFAKDHVPCFKRDTAQYYDTSNILQVIPFGTVSTITDESQVRLLLEAAITAAATTEIDDVAARTLLLSYQKVALDAILLPRGYRQFAVSAAEALKGQTLSAAVIAVTDKIDAVEDLLRLINTTAMSKINSATQIPTTHVMTNIDVVLGNIQLLRAAMIYPKESVLQDRLLLAPGVVQETVMQQFCATSGTEAMVHTYLAYMQINDSMTMPSDGVSANAIHILYPRAQETVQRNTKRLAALAAAQKTQALQDALVYTLDVHYQNAIKTGHYDTSFATIHRHERNRALATLLTKPLDDIALEYLLGMENDPFMTTLYRAINKQLLALMQDNTTITPVDVAKATCLAITTMLVDKLTTKFAIAA